MKRILFAGFAVVGFAILVAADKPSPAEREDSIRYVNNLQAADGGFRASANDTASSLAATNSALRVFKYLDGRPRNKDAVGEFVKRCFDRESGGFADTPGGTPDVRSTALGLMAMIELDAPRDHLDHAKPSLVGYFDKNAKSLAEIYIAEAALDAAGFEPPADLRDRWRGAFEHARGDDGLFGKNAFEHAGGIVTLLRLGVDLKHRDVLARPLRAAQQPDGGFPNADGKSDLASTYRVMRAFMMLKEKPDLARVDQFISKCRNADGGYGATPGQPSTTSTTYFAAIVLHWIEAMQK